MSMIDEDSLLTNQELLEKRFPYRTRLIESLSLDVGIEMARWIDRNKFRWDSLQEERTGQYIVYFENPRHQQLFELAWSEHVSGL